MSDLQDPSTRKIFAWPIVFSFSFDKLLRLTQRQTSLVAHKSKILSFFKGKLRVNWMHPFACVKRLKEKPLREFAIPSCKQWLYVEQALNSSLLKQPPLFSMPESQFRRFAAPEGKRK